MSELAKWPGPGRLVVKDIQGKNRELKPGDTCRVVAIKPAQARRGLRAVGAQAAGSIETDASGAQIRELRVALAAAFEAQDDLRHEIAVLCEQRDALSQQVAEDSSKIEQLALQVLARDERVAALQTQLGAAEIIDKPWLDEPVEALAALVSQLGGKLKSKSPKRADLLAWLYTQPQRSVAEAFAQREGEGA